ncbi:hypothetical protein [Hymenobacter siberiensis]|jgi:hypothetical protein|uniref:hypothetical protein n=1 Tax=Hymenobacter siberiensis TaxID=2848396 RepID=UPI001C1E533E|nr:hypothetical protein [Hymenobacter siberiensis]MBU6123082.1 hypothetical protein [Hymenobacter siberiensis]
MYDFVFNFIYRYHKKGKTSQYRATAASAVAMTVLFQLLCLGAILRHYGLIDLGKPLSADYATNKLLMLPLVLAYYYLFIWFYSHKRAVAIVNQWPKDYDVLTARNIGLVSLIMLGPLFVMIAILKLS